MDAAKEAQRGGKKIAKRCAGGDARPGSRQMRGPSLVVPAPPPEHTLTCGPRTRPMLPRSGIVGAQAAAACEEGAGAESTGRRPRRTGTRHTGPFGQTPSGRSGNFIRRC